MQEITLDSGLKTININFKDRGVITQISFNPSDPDLAVRFSKIQDNINEKSKSIKNIDLNADGTPKNIDFVNELEAFNKIIYDEIDNAFGNKISKEVFQFCNPFACTNGQYFVMQFIEAIAPIIKKCVTNDNEMAMKAMSKYTDKYKK